MICIKKPVAVAKTLQNAVFFSSSSTEQHIHCKSFSVACMLGMALLLNAQQLGVKGDTEQNFSCIPSTHSPRGCKKSPIYQKFTGHITPDDSSHYAPQSSIDMFGSQQCIALSRSRCAVVFSLNTLQLYSGSDQLGLLNLLNSGGEYNATLLPLNTLSSNRFL